MKIYDIAEQQSKLIDELLAMLEKAANQLEELRKSQGGTK